MLLPNNGFSREYYYMVREHLCVYPAGKLTYIYSRYLKRFISMTWFFSFYVNLNNITCFLCCITCYERKFLVMMYPIITRWVSVRLAYRIYLTLCVFHYLIITRRNDNTFEKNHRDHVPTKWSKMRLLYYIIIFIVVGIVLIWTHYICIV